MPITLWTYVPPVVGVIGIALLVMLLRRLFKLPRGAVPLPAKSVAPWREVQCMDERAWRAIAHRWGEYVAGVLATSIGAAALIVTVWALAYVGWTARYGMGDLSNPPVLPPWFGGPLEVVAFAVIGAIVAVVALLAMAMFLGAAWFVGTCILWPECRGAAQTESTTGGNQP